MNFDNLYFYVCKQFKLFWGASEDRPFNYDPIWGRKTSTEWSNLQWSRSCTNKGLSRHQTKKLVCTWKEQNNLIIYIENAGAIFSVGIPPTRLQLYPPKSLSEPDLDLQIWFFKVLENSELQQPRSSSCSSRNQICNAQNWTVPPLWISCKEDLARQNSVNVLPTEHMCDDHAKLA
jgi:hypothetical protein